MKFDWTDVVVPAVLGLAVTYIGWLVLTQIHIGPERWTVLDVLWWWITHMG